MRSTILHYISPLFIIKTLGLWWILSICFVENFIPFGGILPWDSLAFLVGLVIAQGKILHWWILSIMLSLWVAWVIWSIAWYALWYKLKTLIKPHKEQWRYKPSMMSATQTYFDKHGEYAIILSKFTPYIRSLVPMIAGVIWYSFRSFVISTMVGMASWIIVFVWWSYYLAHLIPWIEAHLDTISLAIVIISTLPIAWQIVTSVWKK